MKNSFASRRVARKIGTEEDDEQQTNEPASTTATSVKRPTIRPKKSSQVQRFSVNDEDEDDSGSGVVTARKTNLSRIALQRSAGQRSSFTANELPRSTEDEDDVPTYSAADLKALKESTPSTPRQADQQKTLVDETELDVRDKFGSDLARYTQTQDAYIPSATEIAEKKARRARLALEAKADEYISLDPDDPGWQEDDDGNVMRDMDGRLVLREKDKYSIQQSRLVRDDEDVMEGFDEFTGDAGSRIVMGASTLPVDHQARRNDISNAIANAEGGSDSESDLDEKKRNAAFEAAQTKHGAYTSLAAAKADTYAEYRAKTPPIITPVPDMDTVLRRLRATLMDMEAKKRTKEAEMEQLTKEKFRVRDEETRVQAQLKEVAEKFRQLKMEKGFLPKEEQESQSAVATVASERTAVDDEDDYDEQPSFGLGLGAGSNSLAQQAFVTGSHQDITMEGS